MSDLPDHGRMRRRCVRRGVAHVSVSPHAMRTGGIERHPGEAPADRAPGQPLEWPLVVGTGDRTVPLCLESCQPTGPRRGRQHRFGFSAPFLSPPDRAICSSLVWVSRRWPPRRQASACWRYLLRLRTRGGVQGRRRRRAMRAKPWTPTRVRGTSSARNLTTVHAMKWLSDEPQIDVDADINSTPTSADSSRISRGISSTRLARLV